MTLQVVHEADGEQHVLATDVEIAESLLDKTRGLMLRSHIPDDYGLIFRFTRAGYRSVHMFFVRFPIDVIWLNDSTVVQTKTLHPWRSIGVAKADEFIELPAGTASDVSIGDRVITR